LLLVTKEDLTDSEVLTVQQFLEKNGDVIVLCPSPKLFGVIGEWSSIEGLSATTPNDYLSVLSTSIPIYEPISSTEDGEVALRTADSNLPVLVSKKFENSIHFFSFSVSRNALRIRLGCYGERYLAERKHRGGFAHKELNPLEMSNGPVHESPVVDVLSYSVLERILLSLRDRGILLPFLWNIPDSKDASVLMTMDEDWAIPEVTEDAMSLFHRKSIPLTFFLTTPLSEHENLREDELVEYSVHPFHSDDIFSRDTLERGIGFLSQPPTGFRHHRRLVERPEMYTAAEALGLQTWECQTQQDMPQVLESPSGSSTTQVRSTFWSFQSALRTMFILRNAKNLDSTVPMFSAYWRRQWTSFIHSSYSVFIPYISS
jgi:hypothetical protein